MTPSTLTFLGAVRTVTGSRFLVEHGGERVLVDAGLYQGLRDLRRRNWEDFPVRPADLTAVVLSHAHLDHCGYLPRLVKDGFVGPVICTQETAELAEVVLRDSAHLQEEEAEIANEQGYSRHRPALPLYDTEDVAQTLALFTPSPYDESVRVGERFEAILRPAGHILGSATVQLRAGEDGVQFSGDLGRPHHPLLLPPAPPDGARTLVVESTYGDRSHPGNEGADVMADTINRTVGRGGSVVIPAFAVDRTGLVVLRLGRLLAEGRIPPVPVFVDSPMALRALEIYRRGIARPGSGMRPGLARADLDPVGLHGIADAAGSAVLNKPTVPCVVVSASGMASGGRVVHHLRDQLPDPRNAVLLTGFQAAGTRGRQLLDGARAVKVHGQYVPVRAEVVEDASFSVHADADEVIAWIGSAERLPTTVYVVHGEDKASDELARRINDELGVCAVVPRHGERVLLDRADRAIH